MMVLRCVASVATCRSWKVATGRRVASHRTPLKRGARCDGCDAAMETMNGAVSDTAGLYRSSPQPRPSVLKRQVGFPGKRGEVLPEGEVIALASLFFGPRSEWLRH
jgi:hypothetical protein